MKVSQKKFVRRTSTGRMSLKQKFRKSQKTPPIVFTWTVTRPKAEVEFFKKWVDHLLDMTVRTPMDAMIELGEPKLTRYLARKDRQGKIKEFCERHKGFEMRRPRIFNRSKKHYNTVSRKMDAARDRQGYRYKSQFGPVEPNDRRVQRIEDEFNEFSKNHQAVAEPA